MAYPWYPYPYWYPPDPYAMMYEWLRAWTWYISLTYYMETYKAIMEIWKRLAEELAKSTTQSKT
jgi:hypothetical protein